MNGEKTVRELRDCIEMFYNRQRRHSTLGYGSPMDYEISRRVADPAGAADCDDEDASRFPGQSWYADCDGDGAFDSSPYISCDVPPTVCLDDQDPDGGWSNSPGADCDNEDTSRYPANDEICDEGVDNDCDGDVDDADADCKAGGGGGGGCNMSGPAPGEPLWPDLIFFPALLAPRYFPHYTFREGRFPAAIKPTHHP